MTVLNIGVAVETQPRGNNWVYGYVVTLQADTTARALNDLLMGYFVAPTDAPGSDRPIISATIKNLEATGGSNITVGCLDSALYPIYPGQSFSIPANMLSEIAIAGATGGEDVGIFLTASDP